MLRKTTSNGVHFIGIGGIGVSALARYYLEQGYEVSGSDLVSSEITEALKKKGAKIFIGKHKAGSVPTNVNLVVYSPAVQSNNPELKATNYGGSTSIVKVQSYPEALGELTKKHFTIAVSGTHGKSTTTAMAALILIKAGLDPTVIIGTKLKEFGDSNCRVGKPVRQAQGKIQYLVIEADEHMASFLNYWPKIIVLTNIDKDHLDYYKNLGNILKAFREYVGHLPKNGWLVTNKDDKNVNTIISTIVGNIVYYSLRQNEAKKLKKILKVPGEHNVYNALAALTVARVLKVPDKISFKALSEYKGAWRRFDITHANLHRLEHESTRITIINDYGHHPTKVRATLKAAREKYPNKKIWCVYQPHQYQRTFYLFKDFVKTFREASVDKLIITDIYDVAGRETPELKKKVSSAKLVKKINRNGGNKMAEYIPSVKEAVDYLKENLRSGEAVIVMGAGDIYSEFKKYFGRIN